jgi:hypothetical protein
MQVTGMADVATCQNEDLAKQDLAKQDLAKQKRPAAGMVQTAGR